MQKDVQSKLKASSLNEPGHEKTCLQGFLPGKTQTSLLSYRSKLSHEIANIETRDIILSRQRIRKALIRLYGCAGWSAPFLFAYGLNMSHDEAQIVLHSCYIQIKHPEHMNKNVFVAGWNDNIQWRSFEDGVKESQET